MPKIEIVYRCPDCDTDFLTQKEAAEHCIEDVPPEYKCLHCGFVWSSAEQAIRCYDIEQEVREFQQAHQ